MSGIVPGTPPAASEEAPVYRKVRHEASPAASSLWLIECNEGWRSTVLCSGMYEADADFLLTLLGRTPRGGQ